jgi:ribosomal-protein-alanine N-acetyltransferase
MDKRKYIDTHPGYEELSVPEYSLHKLRLITPDIVFAKQSLDWVSDNEVGQYVGADFSEVSLEGERDRLKEILEDTDGYNWLIECDGKVIGNINISDIKDTSEEFAVKAGSLNYIIGEKSMWGKGITSALVKVILQWAFVKNNYAIIKSRVVPQNKGSIAVLTKAGFKEYGQEDYDGPDLGEQTWYNIYKLTKEEWLEQA